MWRSAIGDEDAGRATEVRRLAMKISVWNRHKKHRIKEGRRFQTRGAGNARSREGTQGWTETADKLRGRFWGPVIKYRGEKRVQTRGGEKRINVRITIIKARLQTGRKKKASKVVTWGRRNGGGGCGSSEGVGGNLVPAGEREIGGRNPKRKPRI